jgi:hypothetical protein
MAWALRTRLERSRQNCNDFFVTISFCCSLLMEEIKRLELVWNLFNANLTPKI